MSWDWDSSMPKVSWKRKDLIQLEVVFRFIVMSIPSPNEKLNFGEKSRGLL
jgi:hypothetical protein